MYVIRLLTILKTTSILILAVSILACSRADKDITTSKAWSANESNPVISYNTGMENAFWADPEVIEDTNGLFQMYLTGKYLVNDIEKTAIYRATSSNSIDWNIETVPVLVPSDQTIDPDFFGVRAATVVFFDSLYHIFYTQQASDTTSIMSIGHAISNDDGQTWLKDQTVLSPSGISDTYDEIQVLAPSAIAFKNKLYLYYGANSWRTGSAYPARKRIIALAVSEDGFTFDSAQVVLEQSFPYTASTDYEGYGNPDALVFNDEVHLYYDISKYMEKEIPDYRRLAIQHAFSKDGRSFIEDEEAIFKRSQFKWSKNELTAPSVIHLEASSEFKMWFAGEHFEKKELWGIGTATLSDENL